MCREDSQNMPPVRWHIWINLSKRRFAEKRFLSQTIDFSRKDSNIRIIKFEVANCKRSKKLFRLLRRFQKIHNKLSKKFPIIVKKKAVESPLPGHHPHPGGWHVAMWQVGLRKNYSPTFFSMFVDYSYHVFSAPITGCFRKNAHLIARISQPIVPKKKTKTKFKFDQFCI